MRDGTRPNDRDYALPGVVGQTARLVAGPAAAAIGFAARHLGQGSPGPFAQAASLTILAEYERVPDCVEALGALNRWPGRSGVPINAGPERTEGARSGAPDGTAFP